MDKKLLAFILVTVGLLAVAAGAVLFFMSAKDEDQKQDNNSTTNDEPRKKEAKMDKIYLNINNKKLTVNLENNSTTAALISLLPLDISMSDLNGNEKYAYLDSHLPTNVYSPKHIEAGDVMLFGNNCLVIFYKSFDTNYDYSKIGHIDNLPELGNGSINVNWYNNNK